jgi:rare lipoprotein A
VRSLARGQIWFLALVILAAFVACTHNAAPKQTAIRSTDKHERSGVQDGYATWYGGGHDGGPTASGERFDKMAMTAAHRTLPMGTHVRVTNKKNGKSVELRINDRGPYGSKSRIIDVSEGAARRLDMIEAGVVPVRVEVVR